MGSPLRIGFLCAHNPYDRNSFSGTPYYMLRTLQAQPGVSVTVLGNHRPVSKGIAARLLRRIRGPRPFVFSPGDAEGLDVVVAPVATRLVARFGAQLPCPCILVTDATPAFLREFYGYDVPLEKDREEAQALGTAAQTVYSSHYMAKRAVEEFPGLDPARVSALPFGINFDSLPERVPVKPGLEQLELLFIGQDWVRKGGALALDALNELLSTGVKARLTVIGASSPEAVAHPAVKVLGYLDKNDPAEAQQFTQALERAHLLVLPTRADCTPMVVAEANSHGCPVVITDTGGIGSLVSAGVNGQMLPMAASGQEWAETIQALTAARESYTALSVSSFRHAHDRLTWDAWARGIIGLIGAGLKDNGHNR